MLNSAPWLLLEGRGKQIWEDVTALVQVFLDDGMGPGGRGVKEVKSECILDYSRRQGLPWWSSG